MKKRISQLMTTAAVVLFPVILIAQEAAEHEGGHEGGLPMVVYLQAINFFLYACLIVCIARKPIREYFGGRQEKFNAALNKAAAARFEAESRKQDILNKIDDLEKNSAQELARAKADALDLQARILKEADQLSAHLRTEATRTATMEIERAKNELRESLLQQSIAFSSKLLKEKIVEGDQKRLQTEFAEKIGANQ